jgi:hypothetical protein
MLLSSVLPSVDSMAENHAFDDISVPFVVTCLLSQLSKLRHQGQGWTWQEMSLLCWLAEIA